MKDAADAGKLLGHRLGDGHDRAKVTKEVQEKNDGLVRRFRIIVSCICLEPFLQFRNPIPGL